MPICVVRPRCARLLGEEARLAQGVAQRLLDVDRLAPLHRRERHQAVHVIRNGDVHRVERLCSVSSSSRQSW